MRVAGPVLFSRKVLPSLRAMADRKDDLRSQMTMSKQGAAIPVHLGHRILICPPVVTRSNVSARRRVRRLGAVQTSQALADLKEIAALAALTRVGLRGLAVQ